MGVEMAEWKGQKKKTSDPHVLKQCAHRPQEVHLNCLAPAASKCASKLREDCIFYEFSFSVAIQEFIVRRLCARLLY